MKASRGQGAELPSPRDGGVRFDDERGKAVGCSLEGAANNPRPPKPQPVPATVLTLSTESHGNEQSLGCQFPEAITSQGGGKK